MTEFELSELFLHTMDFSSDLASLYFTLVSAYLVISYLVGDKLSTPQVTIISALYILWVAGLINGMYSIVLTASALGVELGRLHSNALSRSHEAVAGFGFILVQIGGLLASLYFMWSVRRRRN